MIRNPLQGDLFTPPVIEQAATVPTGAVFNFGGRPLLVVRTYGSDAAAPVIVQELAGGKTWLPGQYAIWSARAVAKQFIR